MPPAESEQASPILAAVGVLSPSGRAQTTAEFEAKTGRLTFGTAPLSGDLVLAGGFEAMLRVSFTADDGNVAVVLEHVSRTRQGCPDQLTGGSRPAIVTATNTGRP